MPHTRVLLETDPQVAELISEGWVVVSESWGARLRVTGDVLDRCREAVETARIGGWQIRELGAQDAPTVVALDAAHLSDYPPTMATWHDVPDLAELASALDAGTRWAYGALDDDGGALAAATVLSHADVGTEAQRIETDFTVTRASARGRGLAKAVKAAAVLALAEQGHALFGTGGAGTNDASRRANTSLGYEITERWLHLQDPTPTT